MTADRSPGMYSMVTIDGVQYVPVSSAHVDAAKIEDAIVSQWSGSNWRAECPSALSFLRIIVTDIPEDDEGETVSDFVARVIAAVRP